jgi:uncharacterized Zn finger protein (UPF0148 family)
MGKYHVLCPECGQSFQDGTGITACPICQVPLLEAAPVPKVELAKPELVNLDLGKLPDHVDVDVLLREAIAEKQSDEEIDSAVERVAQRKYPDMHESLCQLIGMQLDALQKFNNISREDAARQIAESQAELVIGPDKFLEMQTLTTRTANLKGLGHFSAEQSEQFASQIAQALKDGKVHRKIEFEIQGQPVKTSWIAILAAAGFLGVIAWRVWHAAH